MIVAIVTIPAPSGEDAAQAMEQRFAENLHFVEKAPGFAGFELLRPLEGDDHYLSISKWKTRADFEAWAASEANARAHGRPAADGEGHGHGAGAPAGHGTAAAHGGAGAHAAAAGGHHQLPGGVALYEVAER